MVICYHKDTPVMYDSRIRERCGGILEGKPIKTLIDLAKVFFYFIFSKKIFL
jgi:hypothetical protein